ncbi:hypothetical protein CFI11_16030 [Thalassococcus sp. S3]|nr:hypothetical protein CFI11_16030 [Thalassococcus sp. S3]
MCLDDFCGGWTLSRRIDDRQAGHVISAEGRAELVEGVWTEHVTMHLPDQAPITGYRRYLWRAEEAGISVFFDDARAFHRIALGAAESVDRHLCDPDIYDVHYAFEDWPSWRAIWTVQGPRKDYIMETRYIRA